MLCCGKISLEIPPALFPLANVPLIDYVSVSFLLMPSGQPQVSISEARQHCLGIVFLPPGNLQTIEALVSAGVQELFIFCGDGEHGSLIRSHLQTSSYGKAFKSKNMHCILGDKVRFIEWKQLRHMASI